MLKFIKTKTSASRLTALGLGAAITAAATGVTLDANAAFQLSVLLLASAALFKLLPVVAEGGTRALVPACVRVGLLAGSALRKRAAISACTHQGQGDIVLPGRNSIIPLVRVGR